MDPYLVLVNKTHPVPEDYLSYVELVPVRGVNDREFLMERRTLDAYTALVSYVKEKENIVIGAGNSYRSLEMQQETYDRLYAAFGKDYADAIVAPLGKSEHHMGICIDIQLSLDGEAFLSNNDNFDLVCPLFEKHVHRHLSKFGFILRYPAGKQDITGYPYEPWHIRYVGIDAAEKVTESGLTFDEWASQSLT